MILRPLSLKACVKAVSCGKEHVLLLSRIGAVLSYGQSRYSVCVYIRPFISIVASHQRYDVSDQRWLDCLFNTFSRLRGWEKNEAPRYWPFLRGIHRWPVDSPHKGQVTRKVLHVMTSSLCAVDKYLDLLNKITCPWISINVEFEYKTALVYRLWHFCHEKFIKSRLNKKENEHIKGMVRNA